MILLTRFTLKLANGPSNQIKKTPIYIIIIIEFLLITLTQQLGKIEVNWNSSVYLNFLGYFIGFAYITDLILFHVFLRRFCIT